MFTPVCNCCSHNNESPLCLNCVYGDGGLMNHFEATTRTRVPCRAKTAPKTLSKSRRKSKKAA